MIGKPSFLPLNGENEDSYWDHLVLLKDRIKDALFKIDRFDTKIEKG